MKCALNWLKQFKKLVAGWVAFNVTQHSNYTIGVMSMKTSLDLPDELIKEAMQLTDVKTKTKVIVLALQELIKKNKVADLKSYKGAFDLDIDINTLRNRNARFD
jgi:Arc/MetJ family transcription regulator